jgi:hypothetical protein
VSNVKKTNRKKIWVVDQGFFPDDFSKRIRDPGSLPEEREAAAAAQFEFFGSAEDSKTRKRAASIFKN